MKKKKNGEEKSRGTVPLLKGKELNIQRRIERGAKEKRMPDRPDRLIS
jgi:hypothetical protein